MSQPCKIGTTAAYAETGRLRFASDGIHFNFRVFGEEKEDRLNTVHGSHDGRVRTYRAAYDLITRFGGTTDQFVAILVQRPHARHTKARESRCLRRFVHASETAHSIVPSEERYRPDPTRSISRLYQVKSERQPLSTKAGVFDSSNTRTATPRAEAFPGLRATL